MVNRTERGWCGHFIGGDNCQFRRNTLLEYGERKIVVSTVGNYCPTGYETDSYPIKIGHNSYYETMAFHSDRNDNLYHYADVTQEIAFESPRSINESCADNEANDMHETVVDEIIESCAKDPVL